MFSSYCYNVKQITNNSFYFYIVSPNSPMVSALECEASVLRSIHSSGELMRDELRGTSRTTTSSDSVGAVELSHS